MATHALRLTISASVAKVWPYRLALNTGSIPVTATKERPTQRPPHRRLLPAARGRKVPLRRDVYLHCVRSPSHQTVIRWEPWFKLKEEYP